MSQFDVLCVGDVVTDAFIKLLDDQATSYDNEQGKWLAIPFGQKVPYDHVEILEAVGNSSNAAVSFARLGLKSGFVTNVGGDLHGRDMISTLHKNGVDTRFVRINPSKQSNYHYVLWYKEERTILIKHEEYDYHWPSLKPDEVPGWIYFSSISRNALDFHDDLAGWLAQNPNVKLAFQPGTFQIEAGAERLKNIYERTEILIVNREEAAKVSGGNKDDMQELFNRLHQLGPKIVSITDGPAGAYASDGQNRYKMPPYPDPGPPVERTGAGDAFTSTFVASLMLGDNVATALQLAPINSMNVVQHVGARQGLLTRQQLGELLAKAPEGYRPEPF